LSAIAAFRGVLVRPVAVAPCAALFIPDAREWSPAFAAMRSERCAGYYWGSPVSIPPIGAHQIFEGQARFGQVQYLYFASGGKLTWDDVRSLGMLKDVYGEAFETFLHYAALTIPQLRCSYWFATSR
jgi:hypothetical protein